MPGCLRIATVVKIRRQFMKLYFLATKKNFPGDSGFKRARATRRRALSKRARAARDNGRGGDGSRVAWALSRRARAIFDNGRGGDGSRVARQGRHALSKRARAARDNGRSGDGSRLARTLSGRAREILPSATAHQ
jgi:hypothetical protein